MSQETIGGKLPDLDCFQIRRGLAQKHPTIDINALERIFHEAAVEVGTDAVKLVDDPSYAFDKLNSALSARWPLSYQADLSDFLWVASIALHRTGAPTETPYARNVDQLIQTGRVADTLIRDVIRGSGLFHPEATSEGIASWLFNRLAASITPDLPDGKNSALAFACLSVATLLLDRQQLFAYFDQYKSSPKDLLEIAGVDVLLDPVECELQPLCIELRLSKRDYERASVLLTNGRPNAISLFDKRLPNLLRGRVYVISEQYLAEEENADQFILTRAHEIEHALHRSFFEIAPGVTNFHFDVSQDELSEQVRSAVFNSLMRVTRSELYCHSSIQPPRYFDHLLELSPSAFEAEATYLQRWMQNQRPEVIDDATFRSDCLEAYRWGLRTADEYIYLAAALSNYAIKTDSIWFGHALLGVIQLNEVQHISQVVMQLTGDAEQLRDESRTKALIEWLSYLSIDNSEGLQKPPPLQDVAYFTSFFISATNMTSWLDAAPKITGIDQPELIRGIAIRVAARAYAFGSASEHEEVRSIIAKLADNSNFPLLSEGFKQRLQKALLEVDRFWSTWRVNEFDSSRTDVPRD